MSRFRFIQAEKARHPVRILCRTLGVSRAGFYAFHRRRPSIRARGDAVLAGHIGTVHGESRGTYGAPRIHAELRFRGLRCGLKRIARLMRTAGLEGCPRRRRARTTIPTPGVAAAPDLVERQFRPAAENQLWVADITYVRTWQGFLYLAVVIDAFSRRVVGWSMRRDLTAELVVEALAMAIWNRRPAPGLVHHSDQGAQYTSLAFGRHCREAGISLSMGSVGDCYDNAACESSSQHSRPSCYIAVPGPAARRHKRRSLNTSRAGTIPAAGTRRSPISAPLSTSNGTPRSGPRPSRNVSTKAGQIQVSVVA